MSRNILWALIELMLTPGVAMAGQYKMINDSIDMPQPNGVGIVKKHAEVCTEFMKVLEASPPFPPMACEVKFPAGFPDFKVPDWKSVDVWENRDLYMQTYQTPPVDDADKELRLKNLKAYIEAGMVAIRTARFDIDNNGKPDEVMEIGNGKQCDPANKKSKDRFNRGYRTFNANTRVVETENRNFFGAYWSNESMFNYKGVTYYASLLGGVTNAPLFDGQELPDKRGIFPTKYYIRIYRPLPMDQGMRTTWKQPVALGCEYLYLPTNHEGGY